MRNEKGFLHIILYFLIFLMFAITVYVCLDILNLIDVPEEYSIASWLGNHSETINFVRDEISDASESKNEERKVRIEIDKKEDESSTSASAPMFEGYASSETVESSNESDDKPSYAYYYQLDEYGKIIYDALDENLDNMKSGTYTVEFGKTFNDLLHEDDGEETLNQAFQLAINALNFDNPELFYLDISKINLLTKITTKLWSTTYEVQIGAAEKQSYLNDTFDSKNDVERAISAIDDEKAKIEYNLSDDVEGKIRGVHDYLVENLEYDSSVSRDNIYNIYGALINQYTVCEGYARAFKAIMDDLEIPCLIACGTGINSSGATESHAWNYVQIDGNWYAIDVTWDDPVIIGRGFVSRDVNYRYYLKGSREFFTNHIEKGDVVSDANFKYPELSVSNY